MDCVKFNIGSFFSSLDNKVGIGICIKSYETNAFVLPKTQWFAPKYEVHIGETLAFLSTLKHVHELNLESNDFELDSKMVVDSFLSSKCVVTDWSKVHGVCSKTK